MRNMNWLAGGAAMLLASCAGFEGDGTDPSTGFIKELPEGVLAIAALNQDLTSVKIDPLDGCYVYRHVGPVETTFLPLRAVNGRPICSRPPEPAAQPTVAG